jgi:hypothetical protein
MKSFLKSFVIASLCLLTASAGYAQQDGKDGKAIPVEQQPKPANPDEWQFSITPYVFIPTANVDISLPNGNGLDLVRRIAEHHDEVRVLVVFAHLPHMGRRSADDRGSPRHPDTLHPSLASCSQRCVPSR